MHLLTEFVTYYESNVKAILTQYNNPVTLSLYMGFNTFLGSNVSLNIQNSIELVCVMPV